jgi:hypothetical protein
VISVVIPTIAGREHWLGNCIHAYERCSGDIEIITVTDRETCGEAWAEGGKRAQGDFIHFTADDIEPHDGWDEAAILFNPAESGGPRCQKGRKRTSPASPS